MHRRSTRLGAPSSPSRPAAMAAGDESSGEGADDRSKPLERTATMMRFQIQTHIKQISIKPISLSRSDAHKKPISSPSSTICISSVRHHPDPATHETHQQRLANAHPHDLASAVHHQDPSPHFLQQICNSQHQSSLGRSPYEQLHPLAPAAQPTSPAVLPAVHHQAPTPTLLATAARRRQATPGRHLRPAASIFTIHPAASLHIHHRFQSAPVLQMG
ncbi:hypothetical protein ACLOJK_027090 [Asimina triloba]